MATISELQERRLRTTYMLQIDGWPYRVWGGTEPHAAAVPSPYSTTPGLLEVSPQESRYDPILGIAETGAITLSLALTRDNAVSELLRLGWRGAERTATLTQPQTIEQSITAGPWAIGVDEDISAWSATGELWIGQECMAYTARTVAPPFQFTVQNAGRGYYGSQVQEHVSSATAGWKPRITSECVSWRGRRARLLIAARDANGTILQDATLNTDGYIELISGFLDAGPALAADGLSVELTIVPFTAALDNDIGGEKLITGLQQGWHAFDGLAGNRIPMSQAWADGAAVAVDTTIATGIAAGLINCPFRAHQDVFDVNAVTWTEMQGEIDMAGTLATPTGYAGPPDGAGSQIVLSPADPTVGIPAGAPVTNRWVHTYADYEISSPAGTEAVLEWPGSVLTGLAAYWQPSTNKEAAAPVLSRPLWADVTIAESLAQVGGGPGIVARLNSEHQRRALWVFFGAEQPDVQLLVYGLDIRQPGQPGVTPALEPDPAVPDNYRVEIDAPNDPSNGSQAFTAAITGIADAYWQQGERYIHVQEDVFSAAPFVIGVRWHYGEDQERWQWFEIAGKKLANTINANAPGVLLELAQASRVSRHSFGDWGIFGGAKATISQMIAFSAPEAPSKIILRLLLSGVGNAFNDATYDALPYGANLPSWAVDVDSFERAPMPGGALGQWLGAQQDRQGLVEQTSIRDTLDPLLRALSLAIVQRLDRATGRRVIAAIPAGLPNALMASAVVDGQAWAADGTPATGASPGAVNAINYSGSWDPGDTDYHVHVTVNDRDAISEAGGEVRSEELELWGVELGGDVVQQTADVTPHALARFALYAIPRRTYHGTIPWADAALIDVGQTVIATIANGRALDGSLGVTAQPMLITGLRADSMAQRAEITLEWWGAQGTGWAPSLAVTAIDTATKVTVSANAYTSPEHPVTGVAQVDLSYWSAGDVAVMVSSPGNLPGGWPAGFSRTVFAVDPVANTIEFTAAHGLAIGDIIRPADYDSASSYHQQFAFLGDDAETLGAAADDAKLYD